MARRSEALERIAEYEVERYGCGVPVDLMAIARAHRAVVEELPLRGPLDGAAIPMPEAPGWHLIVVNAHQHPVRKRFTIAHELAHVMLHLTPLAFGRGRMRAVSIEWEANRLAAGLLMPRSAVRRAVEDLGPDVTALASRFMVSRAAMQIRLEQLGYLREGSRKCAPPFSPPSLW